MMFDMGIEGQLSVHQEEQKGKKTVQPRDMMGKCKGAQTRNEQRIVCSLESLEHSVLDGKAGWYKVKAGFQVSNWLPGWTCIGNSMRFCLYKRSVCKREDRCAGLGMLGLRGP